MNEELKKALDAAAKELCEMPIDEFRKALEKSTTGEVAQLLQHALKKPKKLKHGSYITIKYSITDEDGCPSHSYECKIPYAWGFDHLRQSLNDAIELFKLRQDAYRADFKEKWGSKDPFEEEV